MKKTIELMGRMTRRELKMSMKMKKIKRVARRREKVTIEKNMARRNTMEEMTKHPMIKGSS
jgi:hypothetical protein